MQRLVLFGKGGSGKTTVASNLSMVYAGAGRRVLHVGCDPKRDSLLCLVDHIPQRSALDRLLDEQEVRDPAELIVQGRLGQDCIDTGGLEAGLGCGGRGVLLVVEAVQRLGLLRDGAYDVALFDVLGDLVCGGFTAPLRPGVGEKVFVVLSDDVMSLFAANSIARAIQAYEEHGIRLGGLLVNAPARGWDRDLVQRFAERLSTRVLATIPRSPRIREAERARRTVVEAFPRSRAAGTFRRLARTIEALRVAELPSPTPMGDVELVEFCRPAPAPEAP